MISVKENQIRKRLLEFCSLMVFQYREQEFDIDPFSPCDFHINYNGNEFDVHSIDEVLNTPFLDGKSMKDVMGELEVVDW